MTTRTGRLQQDRPLRKRVLVADTLSQARTLQNFLEEYAVVDGVSTMLAALSKIENVDLILCEIRFDDSRMYDLLRVVKSDPRTRTIPFVCYRGIDSPLGRSLVQSLDIACIALDASRFVDLFELTSQLGIEDGYARFCEILLGLLFLKESPPSNALRT